MVTRSNTFSKYTQTVQELTYYQIAITDYEHFNVNSVLTGNYLVHSGRKTMGTRPHELSGDAEESLLFDHHPVSIVIPGIQHSNKVTWC
jgi:hypothetical protein